MIDSIISCVPWLFTAAAALTAATCRSSPRSPNGFPVRVSTASLRVTSNRLGGEWRRLFGDAVATTAILDRLLHHSQVTTICGDSSRLRDKRRTGLLQKLENATPITSPA